MLSSLRGPWLNCTTWSGGVTAFPQWAFKGQSWPFSPPAFQNVSPAFPQASQAAHRCLQQVIISLALLSPRPHGPFLEEPAMGVGLLRPGIYFPFCKFMVSSLSASRAEKAMAPHSGTLAWRIPWSEEPGGLQSMGSPAKSQTLLSRAPWGRLPPCRQSQPSLRGPRTSGS